MAVSFIHSWSKLSDQDAWFPRRSQEEDRGGSDALLDLQETVIATHGLPTKPPSSSLALLLFLIFSFPLPSATSSNNEFDGRGNDECPKGTEEMGDDGGRSDMIDVGCWAWEEARGGVWGGKIDPILVSLAVPLLLLLTWRTMMKPMTSSLSLSPFAVILFYLFIYFWLLLNPMKDMWWYYSPQGFGQSLNLARVLVYLFLGFRLKQNVRQSYPSNISVDKSESRLVDGGSKRHGQVSCHHGAG